MTGITSGSMASCTSVHLTVWPIPQSMHLQIIATSSVSSFDWLLSSLQASNNYRGIRQSHCCLGLAFGFGIVFFFDLVCHNVMKTILVWKQVLSSAWFGDFVEDPGITLR